MPLSDTIQDQIKNLYWEQVMDAQDTTTQSPAGEGLTNAITVTFGGAQTSSDGGISLSANGEFEILASGVGVQYRISITLRVSRDSAVGVADILGWQEVSLDGGTNWAQPANSATQVIELDDATAAGREQATLFIRDLPLGAKFRIRFARGEGGPNQGDLAPYVPADSFAGLNIDPSAEVTIRKLSTVPAIA